MIWTLLLIKIHLRRSFSEIAIFAIRIEDHLAFSDLKMIKEIEFDGESDGTYAEYKVV